MQWIAYSKYIQENIAGLSIHFQGFRNWVLRLQNEGKRTKDRSSCCLTRPQKYERNFAKDLTTLLKVVQLVHTPREFLIRHSSYISVERET